MKQNKIDAWIAVNIFGWEAETREMYAGERKCKGFGFNKHLGLGDGERKFIPAGIFPSSFYSTDPASSRELEKKLIERGCLELRRIGESWQALTVLNGKAVSAEADTLEMAIALLARNIFA